MTCSPGPSGSIRRSTRSSPETSSAPAPPRWPADEATARGELAGPLHGLPMTVKDVFETEGLVTTSGAPELARYVPQDDAVAVARLKAAGAIIFGKSNTPMYAGDLQTYDDVYGRTNSP